MTTDLDPRELREKHKQILIVRINIKQTTK
jgi:hypothetical protein